MNPGIGVLHPAREANLILGMHLGPGQGLPSSEPQHLELDNVEKYCCRPGEAEGEAATGSHLYVTYRRAGPSTLV